MSKTVPLRRLKSKRKRVRNPNPIGSNILYTSLCIGRMKDRSLLLNISCHLTIETEEELFILPPQHSNFALPLALFKHDVNKQGYLFFKTFGGGLS